MGMDLRVSFAGKEAPPWSAVAAALAARGWAVAMRMIDGELALPDEPPPEAWRELRVAADGAMVTVRRVGADVLLIAWGNADAAQRRLWHRLAWAFAAAGGGSVADETGPKSAAEFAAGAALDG